LESHVTLFHQLQSGPHWKTPVSLHNSAKATLQILHLIAAEVQWQLLSLLLCVHLSIFATPNKHRTWNSQALQYIAIQQPLPRDRVVHNPSFVV
jgi:hypothetical protein